MTYNKPSDQSTTTNNETKEKKLVRAKSLESIRKFNTYICSQNFYILPALLAWLRAPHHKLHLSLERLITILKHLLFSTSTYLPRLSVSVVQSSKDQIATFLETAAFMKLAVYSAITSIFLQLAFCLYALSGVVLPSGFLFMCTCLYLITQMNYSCLQFFLKEKEVFNVETGKFQKVKRLSRKDILGKRTISNMNLI